MGFSGELVVKNLPANAGDLRDTGLIPGSGRSRGGGHGNPLQYIFFFQMLCVCVRVLKKKQSILLDSD